MGMLKQLVLLAGFMEVRERRSGCWALRSSNPPSAEFVAEVQRAVLTTASAC